MSTSNNNDKELSYKSLNYETGLIEDIDEVRAMAYRVIEVFLTILRNPMLRMFFPKGLILDTVGMAVSAMVMLHQTSQADHLRLLGEATGASRLSTEMQIMLAGLSETLPTTHPSAPTPKLPPLDPNDPTVKESFFLSKIAKGELDAAKTPAEPPIAPLPEGIESFLRELGMNKDSKEGGN